jgi:hypothetical protein
LRDVVVGGIAGFYLDMLLLPGDDDIVSFPTEVDDVEEIDHGKAVEVAGLELLSL